MSMDSMPAGRGMDALVAEKVMRIMVAHFKPIPHYSTDITDAFKIIDNWNSGSYGTFELNCAKIGNEINWHCQFGNYPPAEADTAPLAICRASIKVMGVKA